jgi:hypothetical protein
VELYIFLFPLQVYHSIARLHHHPFRPTHKHPLLLCVCVCVCV